VALMAYDIPTLVFGGGGHGKQVIAMLRSGDRYEPKVVIDSVRPPGSDVAGVEVLGDEEHLEYAHGQGIRTAVNAVGGVIDIDDRVRVFEVLRDGGFMQPPIVHPAAFSENSAEYGEGSHVFALAYVGPDCRLGDGALVNTSAVVSHDCELGDFTNLSPGALLAGNVITGARVRVGMGATVNIGVTVGEGARIGNNATVKGDVPPGERVHAGTIWPIR
jgi:sugar O-acyltransferase (sialic acid O-acetyltransferase NeuD family)